MSNELNIIPLSFLKKHGISVEAGDVICDENGQNMYEIKPAGAATLNSKECDAYVASFVSRQLQSGVRSKPNFRKLLDAYIEEKKAMESDYASAAGVYMAALDGGLPIEIVLEGYEPTQVGWVGQNSDGSGLVFKDEEGDLIYVTYEQVPNVIRNVRPPYEKLNEALVAAVKATEYKKDLPAAIEAVVAQFEISNK